MRKSQRKNEMLKEMDNHLARKQEYLIVAVYVSDKEIIGHDRLEVAMELVEEGLLKLIDSDNYKQEKCNITFHNFEITKWRAEWFMN